MLGGGYSRGEDASTFHTMSTSPQGTALAGSRSAVTRIGLGPNIHCVFTQGYGAAKATGTESNSKPERIGFQVGPNR